MIFFFIFSRKKDLTFQGDNLQEIPKLIFRRKKEKNISKCLLLKFLTSIQSIKKSAIIYLYYNHLVSWIHFVTSLRKQMLMIGDCM